MFKILGFLSLFAILLCLIIIEGTNIGSNRLPIAPQETMNIVKRLASSTRTVVVVLHGFRLLSKPKPVENYVDYITRVQKVTLAELEEKATILVSYRQIVDFLKDLESVGNIAKNSAAILSEPEPQ